MGDELDELDGLEVGQTTDAGRRWEILRHHVDDGVPLTDLDLAASERGYPVALTGRVEVADQAGE